MTPSASRSGTRGDSPAEFRVPRTFLRRRKAVARDIAAALADLRAQAGLGLHLGAGSTRIDGLINCDLFDPSADRKVDATSLEGFAETTVDLIEHHHMIEHLSFAQFETAMREWYRVLQPGGHLVMTCPDIFRISLLYIRLKLKSRVRNTGDELDYAIRMLVGSQEHDGMFHKNHFDSARMRAALERFGMKVVFCYPYPARRTPSMLTVATKA